MCEVLKSNFEQYLPFIEKAVQQAEFIAVDTEFTGLQLDDSTKPSLFDSSEDRYQKLRCSVSQFLACQIGISAFVKKGTENKYSAHSFNFYLFPVSFGPHDVRFQIQASSAAFLCRHSFDFQKLVYEGVSFLNAPQEAVVMDSFKSGFLFSGLEREVDEKVLQRVCSRVAEQFVRKKQGDTIVIHKDKDMHSSSEYLLHSEIRNRFPGVWTRTDSMGNLVVEIVSPTKREELESASLESRLTQERQLIGGMLGFTRIFRILTAYKKPLIGHNMLMDLLFMYEKFYQPLPSSYQDFKSRLHLLFPRIYDTKHISTLAKKQLTDILDNTSLDMLYVALDSHKAKQMVLFSPDIEHAAGFNRYREKQILHEAGYDAFLCGYVFLRLAHIITLKDVRSMDVEPCPFVHYLSGLKPFLNKVNIIRAMINNICLDDVDPPSRRPQLLFVKARRGHRLQAEQLAQWFSCYGAVDVKLQGSRQAMVATGNFNCAKDILASFENHKTISVAYYNMWKHSSAVRLLMWAGVCLSGSVCLCALIFGRIKS